MSSKTIFLLTFLCCYSTVFANSRHEAKTLHFVTIDSGALLAFIPISLLEEIEESTKKPISSLVDGMMGISSGAMVAACATAPDKISGKPKLSMREVREILAQSSATALSPQALSNALLTFLQMGTGFDLSFFINYERVATILERLLQEHLGDAYLSQVMCPLALTTFDVDNRKLHIFDSVHASDPRYDLPLWQAVRASTALEFMFGGARVGFNTSETKENLIDSGRVGYNNPTELLVRKLTERHPRQKIVIYSLGTGIDPYSPTKTYKHPRYPNIEIVRIQPDFSDRSDSFVRSIIRYFAGSDEMAESFDNQYMSVIPMDSYINYIQSKAAPLKQTPEFQRMLRDLSTQKP